MENEPKPVNPYDQLTAEELDEVTLALQAKQRELNTEYGLVLQSRTKRYVETLGRRFEDE